jgi:hypothetical protein
MQCMACIQAVECIRLLHVPEKLMQPSTRAGLCMAFVEERRLGSPESEAQSRLVSQGTGT